jgi:excisionase family DNA binding protein
MVERDHWLTTKELAHALGVSPSFARKLCSRGKIPGATKFGAAWHVPAGALEVRAERPQAPDFPWLSAEEAASKLGVHKSVVTVACQKGQLKAWKDPDFRGVWHIEKDPLTTVQD